MSKLTEWEKWNFSLDKGKERLNDFNNWHILNYKNIDNIPEKPGVYILAQRCMSLVSKKLEAKPINRFLNSDTHGLLDIGEAVNLKLRISQFLACVSKKDTEGHMAGWRLGSLNLLSKMGCTVNDLIFSYLPLASKGKAYEWEGILLNVYFDLFGELPPLNYKFNWSAFKD